MRTAILREIIMAKVGVYPTYNVHATKCVIHPTSLICYPFEDPDSMAGFSINQATEAVMENANAITADRCPFGTRKPQYH